MRRLRKWLSHRLFQLSAWAEDAAERTEPRPAPIPWEQMDEVQGLAHADTNRLASSMSEFGTHSAWMDAIKAGQLQISPHETVRE